MQIYFVHTKLLLVKNVVIHVMRFLATNSRLATSIDHTKEQDTKYLESHGLVIWCDDLQCVRDDE